MKISISFHEFKYNIIHIKALKNFLRHFKAYNIYNLFFYRIDHYFKGENKLVIVNKKLDHCLMRNDCLENCWKKYMSASGIIKASLKNMTYIVGIVQSCALVQTLSYNFFFSFVKIL